MLAIKPAHQINVIDEVKLQGVLDSIKVNVRKAKSNRNSPDRSCSLPANYGILSHLEKEHLKPLLETNGYCVRRVHDEGQGRSWDRLEW